LVCRSDHELPFEVREKISMFCNLPVERVFQNLNASSLYEVPLMLHEEGLDAQVVKLLGLDCHEADITEWSAMVNRQLQSKDTVTIGLVGKYVELPDAYLSVVEALTHGGIHHGVKVKINWIPAETVTPENVEEKLKGVNGIVVPGGFGSRGLEGKMNAIQYVRENNIPFLGLCLGMQMAVIEFARHVLELRDAHTSEVDPHTTYPVIDLMAGQDLENLGGTMRLGKYHCVIAPGTKSEKAYGETNIWERHRHRYEFNNEYTDRFLAAGMVMAGRNPERNLVEIIELPNHPFFVGVQFHPELKSRPNRPHPLFRDFIGAAVKNKAE
nr:CTP synthase [Candidatus Limiplasma sp.]